MATFLSVGDGAQSTTNHHWFRFPVDVFLRYNDRGRLGLPDTRSAHFTNHLWIAQLRITTPLLVLDHLLNSNVIAKIFSENFYHIIVFRLVDESPRWLFFQGRYAEAEAIVRKMLKKNGKLNAISEEPLEANKLAQVLGLSSATTSSIKEDQKFGMADLFKMPRLRNRTFIVALNW